jgi:hypothetical protein
MLVHQLQLEPIINSTLIVNIASGACEVNFSVADSVSSQDLMLLQLVLDTTFHQTELIFLKCHILVLNYNIVTSSYIIVKKLFSLNTHWRHFCMGKKTFRITHRKPQKSFLLSCRTCQRFSGIVICISASPYNQRGFYVVAYYVKLVGTRSPPRVQLAVWFKFIVLPVRCYLYGFPRSISFTGSTALILTGC